MKLLGLYILILLDLASCRTWRSFAIHSGAPVYLKDVVNARSLSGISTTSTSTDGSRSRQLPSKSHSPPVGSDDEVTPSDKNVTIDSRGGGGTVQGLKQTNNATESSVNNNASSRGGSKEGTSKFPEAAEKTDKAVSTDHKKHPTSADKSLDKAVSTAHKKQFQLPTRSCRLLLTRLYPKRRT